MAEATTVPEMSSDFPRDRILGVVYGQATGDAIGLLTEFLDKEEAEEYYNKVKKHLELEHKSLCDDFHRLAWKEGDWTDDTDQMILILMSLIDNNGEIKPVDFAKRLKDWSQHGYPELGDRSGMGLGQTTSKVLHHPEYPRKAAEIAQLVWDRNGRNIAPNGGVMRTSILGIHQYWDTQAVVRNAIEMCQVTHYDPRCRASAVAVSVAISLMLKGDSRHVKKGGSCHVKNIIEDSFQQASTCLDTPEQKQMLREYMEIEKIKKLQLDESGKIGYTYKCMGAGFWALKQKDFRKALQKIVMEGGDADTNGAVAGALLGCKLGISALPVSWVTKLKHKKWLDKKLEQYFKVLGKLKSNEPFETTNDQVGLPPTVSTEANSQSAKPEEIKEPAVKEVQDEKSESAANTESESKDDCSDKLDSETERDK